MASARTVPRCAAAAAVAVLAAGCATVPTVGPPEPVTGASGQARPYVQPVPPQPNAGWEPPDIVQGFLAASSSFAVRYAAARKFLDPVLRKSWKPSRAVTVIAPGSKFQETSFGPKNLEGESTASATVTLTGQRLATISTIGQYLDNPGSLIYQFRLAKFGNQWLITKLPPTSNLLLNQGDFEQVYQPRNLYFWAPGDRALVPEPVFAPQQDTYADVATNLASALISSQGQANSSWLAAATTTAFPRGTSLAGGGVRIVGSSAVVNLRGAAGSASSAQLNNMAAQLFTTLTGTSYSQPPIARSVVLKVNGQTRFIDDQRAQQREKRENLIPGSNPAPTPLYFVNGDGAVSELTGGPPARPVRGPAGRGHIPLAIIAVSPGQQPQLAGTQATGPGCVIYSGRLGSTAPLARRKLPDPGGGRCTSLSWDSQGDIWTVSGQSIWVLPPGGKQPTSLTLPALPGSDLHAYRVLSLRVAPDGVRVAMLIQVRHGPRQLVLAAISDSGAEILPLGPTTIVGASLTDPTSLSWYDADHLLVLARSQLYEVPANGGAAVPIGSLPAGTESISAAGPGQIAAVGHGQVLMSSGPDEIPRTVGKGTGPVYPG